MAPRHAGGIDPHRAARVAADDVLTLLEPERPVGADQPARNGRNGWRRSASIAGVSAEGVSDAVHRSQVARVTGIVGQGPPDFADQHIESGVYDERIGPDAGEQLFLLDDPWPKFDQIAE